MCSGVDKRLSVCVAIYLAVLLPIQSLRYSLSGTNSHARKYFAVSPGVHVARENEPYWFGVPPLHLHTDYVTVRNSILTDDGRYPLRVFHQ